MLRVEKLNAFYGPVQVLYDLDLTVAAGEIVGLVGANAAGKSTLMFSLAGLRTTYTGRIHMGGAPIDALAAHDRVSHGLVLVPERRRLFPFMTVLENLELGAFARTDREAIPQDLERVLALFPRLRDRLAQKGGTLSGGEQQMLAMGRALMAKPDMLLLDEPSMGLSPILVETIFDIIRNINQLGTTILLVEQNARMALRVAHRGYVIQTGRIVLQDAASALLRSDLVRKAYLGEK